MRRTRYWRTVAVDYQAKRWDEVVPPADFFGSDDDEEAFRLPKWGTRYLKLRSTRKLAFAGTLVSLFLPRILENEVSEQLLYEQFSMPPLARLAQLIKYTGEVDWEQLRCIFEFADRFTDRFNDAEFRLRANEVEHPRDPNANQVFAEAREMTFRLEQALEDLFLSDAALQLNGQPIDPLDGYDEPLCLKQLVARYLMF